jgi:CRP/FNR family transcriptional regulator, cyclic AMP receptor protein
MSETIAAFLAGIPYFAGLAPEALADVAARARERSYARGELAVLEGEPAQAVYFVMSGQVRIFKLSAEGRVQALERLGPGATFNLVPALDGGNNPASAEAVSTTTLCVISLCDLLEALRRHPPLALAMLADLAHKLRRLTGLVEDLSFRTVRARLARFLLQWSQGAGRRLTQAEIAAELGTVRDVVGRLLAAWQDEGLIRFERHRLLIREREKLERMAEE